MVNNNNKASGMMPISEIVWEYLSETKYGEERFEDALGFALAFYREELNHNGFVGVKNKAITLTAYKTFKLPEDCIDWIMIAVQVGMRLRKFTRDDSISWDFKDMYSQGMLDVIVNDDKDNMKVYTINNNIMGEDVGQNFHLTEKHDHVGYFSENKGAREITIHPVNLTVNQIVLRYISDCYNQKEETLVPVSSVKVIKAYIDWKEHEHSTNDRKYGRSPRKQELYIMAFDEFLGAMADWNPDDIREMIIDSYSLTPNLL